MREPASDDDDPLFFVSLPASVRESYVFLARKAAQRVTALAHEALGPFGLTLRHFGVLNLVELEPGQNQRVVGARLGIDRTTVVAVTDDLERAGLLERRRGKDRRSFALYLTPVGVAQLKQLRKLVDLAQEDFLAPLAADERDTLRELLGRLVA
ncbi:DNA-binding MarR family transcriptional regulator [Catenulispora sp. MAP12-49]|uniref:MarR family winged helix-turn-helix transcriptional regulator n=1 Tax=unclassified Catenulispora TaxID=414885 RepID=UPI00351966C6